MNDNPIILLDIDGVFNSLGRIEEPALIAPHTWGRWQITEENLKFLKDLSKHDSIEVFWFSTWGEESNELNEFLEIKHFKNVFKNSKKESFKEIRKLYPKRKILVVDDEFAFNDINTLTIKPNEYIGLNFKDRENILEWIKNNGR